MTADDLSSPAMGDPTTEQGNEQLWERNAAWWQSEYTLGADPEYEDQILPLVARHLADARHVLDVGCGEGQVARHLASLGVTVTGLDPIQSQMATAVARGGGPTYARARADALPCRSGAFDAVLVCLAIEHVDELEAAIREVARVLEPGGRFVLVLCHPLLQTPGSGWIDDHIVGERYWRVGPYLDDDAAVDEVAPGVELRFIHRPLHRYVKAMSSAGLLIDDLEEPAPPTSFIDDTWGYEEAVTIPRVMLIRARRPISRSSE
ncbi:MAG: class I SAM-dependent methyltransferase [Acidimicrobiia bacterium]